VQGGVRSLAFNLVEFLGGSLTDGALLGSGVTLVNISAYGTNKFFHLKNLLKLFN
jgi:hypothetical protein